VVRDPRDVEIKTLRKQLSEVLARLDAALAQNTQLAAQLAKLNERVAELLPIAKRKKSKQRPAAPTSQTPPPMLDAAAQKTFDERPRPPVKPDKPAPSKRTTKPSGRKPVPSHLEAETHELRPDVCAGCGSAKLDVVDEVLEEKLHVVKEHQRRRVVRRKTCRCRACGERTTPRSLPAPYERSKVTCEWLAWLVYSKFVLLMPLDRIRRDLAERGVHIAMGTLVSLIERAADILAPVDGVHWKSLLASSWMATDGTGLKVLVPELETAHNGYIELYRRDD
jgi:transposase